MPQDPDTLQTFIDSAPAALAMLDRNLRYLAVSPRWREDFGFTGRDLRGLHHHDVFPEISDEWKRVHARALAGETLGEPLDRFERQDGTVQWVRWQVRPWRDAQGGIGGILIYSENVGPLRCADEALVAALEQQAAVVNAAMDAVIVTDGQGHIVMVNAAAAAMFGLSQSRAPGTLLSLLLPDAAPGPLRGRLLHAAYGEAAGHQQQQPAQAKEEHRLRNALRSDGRHFLVQAAVSRVDTPRGELCTYTLRDVSGRMRTEHTLRGTREKLRGLARATRSAQEEERTRVARELQDGIAQVLAGLLMDIHWTENQLTAGQEALRVRLTAMHATLRGAINAACRLASDMRPAMLDNLGLDAAMEWLTCELEARTGARCALAIDAVGPALPEAHATGIFRIAQESFNNIARHAHATVVDVALRMTDDRVELRIRDNGVGFYTRASYKPGCYGLLGLRERASLLGGEARIDSAPGEGTVVKVRLPLPLSRPASGREARL